MKTDVTKLIDAEDIDALCPFCDCAITDDEISALCEAHGYQFLAHWTCIPAEGE